MPKKWLKKLTPTKMQMFCPRSVSPIPYWNGHGKRGPRALSLMGPHLDDLHQFFIGFTFDPLLRIAFDPEEHSCPLRPAIKNGLGFLRGLPFLRASTVDQSWKVRDGEWDISLEHNDQSAAQDVVIVVEDEISFWGTAMFSGRLLLVFLRKACVSIGLMESQYMILWNRNWEGKWKYEKIL